MRTGPSSDSANPSSEPDPPVAGSRRHSWLSRHLWHPITWVAVGLVLLGGSGAAVLLHEPGGRAQAQSTYCGLVTCAVLRSTAATSRVPTPGPSSPLAASRTSAPTATTSPSPTAPSPRAAAVPTPTPRPAPNPAPTSGPEPSRWPWPVWWPPARWWGHGHGYPAAHSGGLASRPGSGR
jgi:hypothetical protein